MDIVVVADGRSECARREIRKEFESHLEYDFLERWIIYEGEACLSQDLRNVKRKIAWGGTCHNEVLFVSLPSATKGQRKIIKREAFTKCGESTNYSRSYTGVQHRTFDTIPRLTAADKAAILGQASIGDGIFARDLVQNDIDLKGHPLFSCEWKPTSLYTELCRDFQVTDVVDLTVGSRAAALGALSNKVHYFGVCVNHHHLVWVRRILQCESLTTCVSHMK